MTELTQNEIVKIIKGYIDFLNDETIHPKGIHHKEISTLRIILKLIDEKSKLKGYSTKPKKNTPKRK